MLKSWKTTSRRPVLTFVLISCFFGAFGASTATAVPTIDTYAGGGNGDGNFAFDASLDPRGFSFAGSPESPDVYIADYSNNLVRKVSGATGLIETIAGNGDQGWGGDGGSAVNAKLNRPTDVAVDGSGNAYIADYQNNRVRKVSANGVISTFAGTGSFSFGGDGGLATQASLHAPFGVAVGPDGYVYIADQNNNRIRRVGPPGCTPSTCVITTAVGNGAWGFGGDGGPALNATLKEPSCVRFDSLGNMLITDRGNDRVRRVSQGVITTIAGGAFSSVPGQIGDGGPATSAVLYDPYQAVADADGNVYIADNQHRRIRMVSASNGFIYTVAGNGAVVAETSGDGGPATQAGLFHTFGVATTPSGTFWFSQYQQFAARSLNNRLRRVSKGIITSVVGGGLGHGGAAYDAQTQPRGADARPGRGVIPDLYYADGNYHSVRYVDGATGDIFTIAGTGSAGYSGDDGPAVLAKVNSPTDVAVDSQGNVYIADTFNNVVRRITNGYIDTVAGTGTYGSSGDGGPATRATLAQPLGVAVGPDDRLYIADTSNNRIRVVDPNGIITTLAGTGAGAYGGDGGPAVEARLRSPRDVAVASDGTVFIADSSNHRIRVVDKGIITTYAGLGWSGFSGDGGPALSALLNVPGAIDIDASGRVYFADTNNRRVRVIDTTLLHNIATVAGNGANGYSGDGGAATAASFSEPDGVAIDQQSSFLFINSDADGRSRIVSMSGGTAPTPSFTATAVPPTPTRTPTFAQSPTRTATATRTNTSGLPQASVFGGIQYYSNNQNVSAATVTLTGSATTSVTTNSRGDYSASVPQGTWSLEPSKLGGFGTAVTSLDAARVLQLLSGLQTFTENQRLACDASGNGSLSTLDAVYILQFSAGLIDRLPAAQMCNSDWLFVPDPAPAANQAIVPPLLTTGNCQQGAIILNPLVGSVDGQDFAGILLGDCTGNWTTASASLQRQRTATATVHAGRARKAPSGRYTVPLYVKSAAPFQALDLKLEYDGAASFVAATARGDADEALISTQAADGTLSISLASGTPISGSKGSVILLQFRGADPAVTLDGALVDEQRARVVSH